MTNTLAYYSGASARKKQVFQFFCQNVESAHVRVQEGTEQLRMAETYKVGTTREHLLKGRISTVDLLVLTSLNQLIFTLKKIFTLSQNMLL
jgi:hypothetical protein